MLKHMHFVEKLHSNNQWPSEFVEGFIGYGSGSSWYYCSITCIVYITDAQWRQLDAWCQHRSWTAAADN